MMVTVGRVSVGFISIELRAVTGEVFGDRDNWSVRDADGRAHDVSYEQGLFESGGASSSGNLAGVLLVLLLRPILSLLGLRPRLLSAPMRPGDRVALFWGVRRGKESDLIAIVNYSLGVTGIIPQQLNDMIVPPLYTPMIIIAIFGGVFGVFALFGGAPGAIVFLPFSIGFFMWIRKRQKALQRAIEAAAAKLKPRPEGEPTAAVNPDAIRI